MKSILKFIKEEKSIIVFAFLIITMFSCIAHSIHKRIKKSENKKICFYGVVKNVKYLSDAGFLLDLSSTIIKFNSGQKFIVGGHLNFDKKCCEIYKHKFMGEIRTTAKFIDCKTNETN